MPGRDDRDAGATLTALSPAGEDVEAVTLVRALDLSAGGRDGRPRTVGIMIASIDGRAAVHGRSVALGCPADRALLRALRAEADAILVGSATLVAERYANLLDPAQRRDRDRCGRPEHPLLATVSRRLDIDRGAVPAFGEPGVASVIFTELPGATDGSDPIAVHRMAPGALTLTSVLERLASSHGVRSVTCEGGPTLLGRLVAEDCLDDLLLTISPLLAGSSDGAPTIMGSSALAAPAGLALADVHRAGDHLFLHYVRRA